MFFVASAVETTIAVVIVVILVLVSIIPVYTINIDHHVYVHHYPPNSYCYCSHY